MTLTELRYIVAVARERHFGRAAQTCFVSQPTLSVGIKKIEEELGVAIFERGSGEITLTPVGEQIVAQAARTLDEAAAIKNIARESGDPLAYPLRLGAIYTIGPYLLPLILPIMRKLAPSMQLIIQESYTASLREQLKQGKLDVAILSLPFEEPGMVVQPLYDEPFQVAMPANHPWQQREAIPPADLGQEPVLLLGAGNCFRDQVLQVCPNLSRSATASGMQQTLEGSSLETIRYMVASGVGMTILPCTATNASREENSMLRFRPFTLPSPKRRVALVYRKSFTRPQAVEAVRLSILQAALPCVEWIAQ
ncbi:MAG TPA: hydrogen peroxide-inducible genes activator [Methylophilaceae bacterium]|nr:hydrogen peroxide-inducible genes activator [Methylophilaceae bacterium]HQR60385.1 hydrogen peroxide-inducible genes activator [Methylophilaceae bacterium]